MNEQKINKDLLDEINEMREICGPDYNPAYALDIILNKEVTK